MSEDSKAENAVKQLESKFGALKAYIFNACAVDNKLSQPVRDDLVGEPKEIKDGDISVENFAMLRQQVDDQIPPFFDITDKASKNNFLAFIKLKATLNYLKSVCSENTNILADLSVDNADSPLMEQAEAFALQVFAAFAAMQNFLQNSLPEQRANFKRKAEDHINGCNGEYAKLKKQFSQKLAKGSTSPATEFAKEYVVQLYGAFENAGKYYQNPPPSPWKGVGLSSIPTQAGSLNAPGPLSGSVFSSQSSSSPAVPGPVQKPGLTK